MNLSTKILNRDKEPAMQSFKSLKTVTDKKGKPKEKEVLERRELILRDLVETSLLRTHNDDLADYDLKIKKYELYEKIQGEDEIELNEDEKTLLTRAVCQTYEVLFAGQAVKLIQ